MGFNSRNPNNLTFTLSVDCSCGFKIPLFTPDEGLCSMEPTRTSGESILLCPKCLGRSIIRTDSLQSVVTCRHDDLPLHINAKSPLTQIVLKQRLSNPPMGIRSIQVTVTVKV